MDLPIDTRGALVYSVTSGSPADDAGLRGSTDTADINGSSVDVGGDVILSVDGVEIDSMDDLIVYLYTKTEVGQQIELELLRSGESRTVTLTLGARPGAQPQQASRPQTLTRGGYLGISGVTMAPALAEAMDLDEDTNGILIVTVESGSPADEAGLQAGSSGESIVINGREILLGGDVITAVDGRSVASIQALRESLAGYDPGDEVSITILRGGSEQDVQVTLGELN
jgi:S1-C subfamily serine protease